MPGSRRIEEEMTTSDKDTAEKKVAEAFKTLKAAKAAGYQQIYDCYYGGEQIQLKGHILVRHPKIAISKSAWLKLGFSVRPGEPAHATVSGRVGDKHRSWWVYREDQVRPKRVFQPQAPQIIPILSALWAINRAAKRFRDAASSHYAHHQHGLSSFAKEKKQTLYQSKAQALYYLVQDGTLQHSGYHCFSDDKWAEVLTGSGFTFHRPCEAPDQLSTRFIGNIQAKPRSAHEPRLCDAIHTVTTYLSRKPVVEIYRWPARERFESVRYNHDDYDDVDDDESFNL
jgi:hypothetical protein